METGPNREIKLTWPQITWLIAGLIAIVFSYTDVKHELMDLRKDVGTLYTKAEVDKIIVGIRKEYDKELHELEESNLENQRAISRIRKRVGLDD